jgi:GT2 family glycosyltransferase
MLLSIVIPTHQRTDLLHACLSSVVRHAPRETEIIVVDDASPQPVASALRRRFPATKILRLSERGGFCKAANAGIELARGEVVELLNDDTEVQPGWAEAALPHFARSEVAAVAPLVLFWPDGARIDSAGDHYFLGGVARKRGHGEALAEKYLHSGQVLAVSACAAFYRREALLAAGGFPEDFGAYFDDIDLSFRLRRAGHELWYEPAARVLHHGAASHGTTHRRLLEQQSRNEERVFWRNVPAEQLWKAVPQHAAVLAGKAWRRWHAGEFLPFVVGRLRVLREVAAIRQHRQRLG